MNPVNFYDVDEVCKPCTAHAIGLLLTLYPADTSAPVSRDVAACHIESFRSGQNHPATQKKIGPLETDNWLLPLFHSTIKKICSGFLWWFPAG
ncbi:hypothetical protein I7I50_03929 [Histoplasma capsulatum G186AR]|uniref:Uncharacterized protein n=1 Tax=Ajellomyces capsulatus TaxID=5037 RepID=A0A8H7YLW8_AJECA|nr:hypothetical protein I7I52_04837 [Histoplasma capsulatum]QSS74952.1 hypothetical protein I7I50_03929 [Histoplasma capsulatum G186AR]